MTLALTENEILVLDMIKNADTIEDQRDDNYSNFAFDSGTYLSMGMSAQAVRGVVGSLVKKDLVWVDEAYGNIPSIVYYTDEGMEVAFA